MTRIQLPRLRGALVLQFLLLIHALVWRDARGQACNETTVETQKRREDELLTFLMANNAQGEFLEWTKQEAYLNELYTPNASLSIVGVGTFGPGRAEAVEYAALNNPPINGNRFQILNSSVYNSTWLSDNVLEVYTKDFWRVNKTSIEQGYSRVVDGLYGFDRNVISYVDCSTQIWNQESQLDDAVLNSINKNIFGTLSPPDICFLAQASCAGSLYPFDTVYECIQFMQNIPVACNDGENSLRGNTSNCRYLHAVAASVAPTVHCQHVAKDSTFCVQDSCVGQEYGPLPRKRLGQRSDVGEDNSGYQITSVSVLAFIVGFLPAAIYLVYLAAGVLQMRRVKGALLEDGYTAVAGDVAPSPVTKSPTQLRVHDFGYTTPVGRQLLLDVNFKASGGDIIAVMGPSGAGKTTLLKSLAGIPMPGTHRGGVLYDEVSVMDRKSKLAFVPQYPEKVNLCQPLLTAREFLIVQALSVYQQLLADKVPVDGLTRDEFVADSIARVVQAMSLATFLDTQVNRLSGGQHKRLSAAYHLISDPRVLILDEPTSGLDSFAAASMMASLRQLAMKRSMLIIASIHQPPNTIMAEFDYVLLMKAGGVSIVYEKAPLLLDRQEDLHQRVRVFANTNQGMCSVVSSTVVAAFLLADMEMTGKIELGAGGSLLAVADVLAILGNAKGCVSVEEASNVLRTEAEAPKYKTNGGRDALIGLAGIMDALVRQVELTHAIDTSSLGSLLLCTAELAAVVSGNFAVFHKSLARFRSFKSFKSLELDQRGELTDWTLVPLVEGASSLRHRMNLIPILAWSHWQATPKLDQLVYHVGCFVAAGFMAMMYPQLRVQAARELYGFASSFLVLLAIVSNLVFLNQVLQRISREREMLAQAYTARGDSLAVRVVTMLLCNSASSVVSLMLMFWLYFFVVGWDILHLSFASLINSMLSMKIVLDLMAMFGTVAILYLPQAGALGLTGFWLGWNTIFAGVLIRVNDLWVIWTYWSCYVSPFYHIINVWLWEAFYNQSITCFPQSVFPSACPADGNQVLIDQGYSNIAGGYSLAVLLGTWGAYGIVLAFLLCRGSKPYSSN